MTSAQATGGGATHQSKWSWKPPKPWTELRYWYRPLSPSRVDTCSPFLLSTVAERLQRIFPGAGFTSSCSMAGSDSQDQEVNSLWVVFRAGSFNYRRLARTDASKVSIFGNKRPMK